MVKDHSESERKPAAATTWSTLFRLVARYLLYAPSHRYDRTYHGLCYTSKKHDSKQLQIILVH